MMLEKIRLNWHYVIWYKNFTALIASLVVPFALLAYWNINTFAVIRMRRRLRNRPFLPLADNEVGQGLISDNFEGPNLFTAEIAIESLNNGTPGVGLRGQNSNSDQGIGNQ